MKELLIRSRTGLVLTVTGVVACPCHLPLTLPFVLAVLGGTSVGLFLSQNPALIYGGATLYFVGASALGLALLGRSGHKTSRENACCIPLAPTVRSDS